MKKLLEALECPFLGILPPSIDELFVKDQVVLVGWLEDRCIREFELKEREGLRVSHPNCLRNISTYLSSLGCPFSWNEAGVLTDKCPANIDALTWLVEHAVQLTYEDSYGNEATEIDYAGSSGISKNCNGGDDDFEEEVNEEDLIARVGELGDKVGVRREDQESTVEHLRRIITKIQASAACYGTATDTTATLKDFPLGFDTGDATLNEVLVVLKMLYLKDLRSLQDEINQLMMLCQNTTANPRLNPALGQVGR